MKRSLNKFLSLSKKKINKALGHTTTGFAVFVIFVPCQLCHGQIINYMNNGSFEEVLTNSEEDLIFTENTAKINLNNFQCGFYLLQLTWGDGVVSRKFVVGR